MLEEHSLKLKIDKYIEQRILVKGGERNITKKEKKKKELN